ncbi:MAG: metallophosphoesterase family protein [Thermosipho sp. (in: Bacteria)]|nr:metallophosphoesterase family protein [Thermosipho sp. (in: thermotogales)]
MKELKNQILRILSKERLSLVSLSNRFDRSMNTILKAIEQLQKEGFEIVEEDNEYYLKTTALEDRKIIHNQKTGIVKFGLVSDTHLCSKKQQLTYLNDLYDIFEREGIHEVYHTGDILDGENMYREHRYEVFLLGADAQIDYAVKNYPKRKGIKTYFITGNHDLSFYKASGLDIGFRLEQERDDLIYLGKFAAVVKLGENTTLELMHPDSGGAYAISYKPQKIVSGYIGGEKPNILALGHWHQAEYLFERNVHVIQTSSFQGQTAFLKRKGIMPKIGGWIIETHIDEEGTITRFKQEYITFYKEIKNDY